MLILLAHLASSGIFGIDFGSEFIKISSLDPSRPAKGITISINQQSKRLSPSYFAFWNLSDPKSTRPPADAHWPLDSLENYSWCYLDPARSHGRRFPHNILKGYSPVIGFRKGFEGREVIALLLRHLLSTIDESVWKPETASIVFTVEPLLSRSERFAITEAAALANVTLLSIVEAPTAAAYVYALERRKLFEKSSKVVAFFDIGALHTWAAIFRFTPGKKPTDPPNVEELAVAYNRTLGAELIDRGVGDRLIQRFEAANSLTVTDERVRRQFYDEARRVKEVLTVDQRAVVRLEELMDDRSLHFTLQRSEFDLWIDEFNSSLHNLFDDVVAKAGLSAPDVDSIELLGGTTRVPFVQQSLMTVSGMNKLNRTMNSDEAIALGAGYIGASLSHSFQVAKIGIKPIAYVNVTLVFPSGEEIEIFNKSSRTTDIVSIGANSSQLNGTCEILCDGVRMSEFRIPAAANDSVESFTLSFHFNKFTIPAVYAVALNNGTKKETANYIVVKDGPPSRLPRDAFLESARFITRMEQIMKDRANLQRVKNEYESLIYHIKGRLEHDPVFNRVVSEEERQRLISTLEAHEEWLGNGSAELGNLSEFTSRLAALRETTGRAEFRAAELVKRPAAFEHLNETLAMVENVTTKVWPETRPWLSQSHYNSVGAAYNQTRRFYDQKLAAQALRADTEDPAVTVEEIEKQRNYLEQIFNIIDKIKKPSPSPSPTPSVSLSSEMEGSKKEGEEGEVKKEQEPLDDRPDRTPFDNDDL